MKRLLTLLVFATAVLSLALVSFATTITEIRPDTSPVPLYGKFEVEFDLSTTYINPFDPDEVDATLKVMPPSGGTLAIPAFWYQDYARSTTGADEILTAVGDPCWVARFAPTETGVHTYYIEVNDSEPYVRSADATFTCNLSADGGYVRPDPSDSRLFTFDDGSYYLPIGQNVAWAGNKGTYDYDVWFTKMGANGVNWTRIWMTHFYSGQTLEWSPNWTGYFHGLGVYSLECGWKLDYMVELAREKGIYIQLVTQHHGQFSLSNYPNWDENPYNDDLGGGILSAPEEFFTNAEAKDLYKRKMRYTIARWGYSTSILCWEFWNEVGYTNNYDPPTVASWTEEMAQYVELIDPWEHMLTTSVGAHPSHLSDPVWDLPEIDCTQPHLYVSDITNTIGSTAISMWTHDKPVIVGEFGCCHSTPSHDPDGTHIHNGIWSAAMAMTGAMSWWWGVTGEDYIDFYDLYYHYAGLNSFFQGEDLRDPTLDVLSLVVDGANGYGIGASNCAYVWIQDPLHVLGSTPVGPLSGVTLEIPDMTTGFYDVEYWDTFLGTITGTEVITCSDGTLSIDIPEFSLDLALKARLQETSSVVGGTLDPATHVMACGENITYQVNVDGNALDLMGAAYKISYDTSKLSFVSAVVGDLFDTPPGNIFQYVPDPDATGVLQINSSHLSTGVNGPGEIAEVTFLSVGSTSPGSTPLTFSDAELRDSGNQTLPSTWTGASVVIDCVPPTISASLDAPASPWTCYNTAPTVNISATDDYDLDCIKYKIDVGGTWTDLICSLSGTSYGPTAWPMPDYAGLADETTYTYYFKSTDDAGNESGETSVTFTKDETPPSAVTDFTATVGHNQIVLDWTNPVGDVDRVYLYRNDWTDYPVYGVSPGDPGYPSVGSFDLDTDVGAVETYTDATFDNTTRGIYAYRAVVYDCAGNYAAAGSDDHDRATSYFLGDIADNIGSYSPNYDGLVSGFDYNQFSLDYWSTPSTGTTAESDFAPTIEPTRGNFGIPQPDDYVGFEDLMIFAMNYGNVPPPGPPGPPLLGVELAAFGLAEDAAGYRLSLREVSRGGGLVELALVVEGNDVFKGLSAELEYEGGLEFISAMPSDALLGGSRVMFMGGEVDGVVRVDFAALGGGVGIGGNGSVATLSFQTSGESGLSVRITSADARDVDNSLLLLELDSEVRVEPGMPVMFALRGNSPNPFTGSTEIHFDVPREASVSLRIYNIQGQMVQTLVDGSVSAGRHSETWDGLDRTGHSLPSGVYFVKMSADDYEHEAKVLKLH